MIARSKRGWRNRPGAASSAVVCVAFDLATSQETTERGNRGVGDARAGSFLGPSRRRCLDPRAYTTVQAPESLADLAVPQSVRERGYKPAPCVSYLPLDRPVI